MEKNQKRLVAVVLCIIGIVGTLMAVRDAGGRNAASGSEAAPTAAESVFVQTPDRSPAP